MVFSPTNYVRFIFKHNLIRKSEVAYYAKGKPVTKAEIEQGITSALWLKEFKRAVKEDYLRIDWDDWESISYGEFIKRTSSKGK